MPRRKLTLRKGHYYHVFNRTINKELAFKDVNGYLRALKTIEYYTYSNPPKRLSFFLKNEEPVRTKIIDELKKDECLVDIVCFCLMPDHYHLLLKQNTEKGISDFMSKFQNSYTKYVNIKHDRYGHLFAGQFKAVRMPNDNILLHVSRYIHLNPISSFVVESEQKLLDYPYSSIKQFLGFAGGFCKPSIVLDQFRDTSRYKKFLLNQKDYQKKLKTIRSYMVEK